MEDVTQYNAVQVRPTAGRNLQLVPESVWSKPALHIVTATGAVSQGQLTTLIRVKLRSRMTELYINHLSICLHGVVLN
jgi:hypothetical protein